MTNEECRNLYDRLTEVLLRLELQWVVKLTEDEISAGKLITQQEIYRPLSNRSDQLSQSEQQLSFSVTSVSMESSLDSSRSSQKSLMAVEYSDSEKLNILLTFIKQAVVDTTFLENEVVRYFGNDSIFAIRNSSIFFSDPENDDSVHILSLDNVGIKKAHARNLNSLLDEILGEIKNAS